MRSDIPTRRHSVQLLTVGLTDDTRLAPWLAVDQVARGTRCLIFVTFNRWLHCSLMAPSW
jgi:hypothetical protein